MGNSVTTVRLCLLTTSYPRHEGDDAGIFVKRLALALDDAGCSGIIVVPRDREESALERQGHFEICRFRYGFLSRGALAFGAGILPNVRRNPLLLLQAPTLLLQMTLSAYRKRESFDIVQANWVISGLVAWILSLITRKPFVLTVRGEDAKLLRSPMLRPLFYPMLKKARAIVTVNEGFRELLVSRMGLPPNRVLSIPNGVSVPEVYFHQLQRFADYNRFNLRSRYALFVGRIIPLKRIEKLIELLAHPQLNGLQLLLCGSAENPSYEQSMRTLIQERNLNERVHWCGRVPPEEVPHYLAVSSLYISASSYEGRSNSMLEALAAGLLVVASDIPGHREIVHEGSNGLLLDFDDIEKSANRVREVLENKNEESRLRCQAFQSVREYSWSETAQKYLKALQDY